MEPRQIIESPVRSLFSSNDEPTEEQTRWIQDTVCLLEADLDINPLDSPEARSRHEAYALFCNMHRSLLSPARRVPYDIWELIIRSAVHNNREFGNLDCTFRVGSVCRVWNTIAKSIPELSSILPPIHFTRQTNADPVLLDRYCHRIASLPSSIPLSVQFPDPISVDCQWQFITVASLPYSTSRWESLSIKMNPDALCRGMFPTDLIFSTTGLRQMQIYVVSKKTGGHIGECDVFKASSSLRNIEVECMAPFSLQLPWHQLTSYKEISHRSTIGMEAILRRNQVLEKLEYRTDCADVIVGENLVDKITFNRLRSIDIRVYNDTISGSFSFLDKLLAPSLQTLRMRYRGANFYIFLDFIKESACGPTLTTLILDTYQMEPGKLMEILKCTPMLTFLECNDIPLTDLYMLSMKTGRGKESTATLAPLLRNLVVHSPSFIENMNDLARDRSRIYQNASYGRSETSSPFNFSVKLVFSDRKRSQKANEVLFRSSGDLESARSTLADTLCELDIQVDEFKAGIKKELSSTWRSFLGRNPAAKMDDIFRYLASVPIETMPEAMPWAIHVLERFSLVLDSTAIPHSNVKYKFIDICKNLLCSWRYLLKRQSVSQRWILHGNLGLLYVANAHSFEPDYKFTEDKDTFWGDYNFSENKPFSEYIEWRRKLNFD